MMIPASDGPKPPSMNGSPQALEVKSRPKIAAGIQKSHDRL